MPKWALGLCTAIVLPFSVNAGMDKNPVVENLQRPFDWTGFYIGGNIGGVLSEYEFEGRTFDTDGHLWSHVDLFQQLIQVEGSDAGPTGLGLFFVDQFEKDRPNRENFVGSVIGGGQLGYQRQFGHFVIGVEGDFDRTSIRDIESFREEGFRTLLNIPDEVIITGDTLFFGRREAQTNWQASARLKAGYATGPLLFYATGGVAFADINVWAHDQANTLFNITTFNDDDIAFRGVHIPRGKEVEQNASLRVVNTNIDKENDVMVGWTAGAGLEVAFNDAVTLALEYRHNDFGDQTFGFDNHDHNGNVGPIFSGDTNVDFSNDQVVVKMNILLNHMFGHGAYTSVSPATNNVAIKSPFGGKESVQVGYTKSQDADKWSAKEVTKVEEPFNWTGFYVGGNVGGVWTDYDFNDFDAETNITPIFEAFEPPLPMQAPHAPTGNMLAPAFASFHVRSIDGGSDDSIIGGGQVGYQHQFGNFVVGVEGDFSGLSTEKKTTFASTSFAAIDQFAVGIPTLYTERKATVDWMASARLKFGYARGPVMLYVTGGGAWAKVRTWATDLAITDFFTINDGDENFAGRDSNNTNDEDTVCGWTVGGGGEWAFSKIASLAMEYRHNEFDAADSHYDPHHSTIFAHGNSVDLDSDQVTVKVNLLLGHMGPGH